jgi:glycosyltransferase involved in cell wall biosynthesis
MAYFQFYYPKRIAFGPVDYEQPGLGGSEVSIVLLTSALVARGHKVDVFNAVWKPGVYDGVNWRGAWEIENTPIPDVFVAVRYKSAILNRKAKHNLFWMLDDRCDGALAFSQLYPSEPVILASDAMIRRLRQTHFSGRTEKILLPIEVEKYNNSPKPSTSQICLHTSMPNRGLIELLKFWHEIHEQTPNAELHITSGWELWGYTEEEARDRVTQTIGSNYQQKGITFTGVLSRSDLITLQRRSRLGLYPSFFPEMFCLAAAEMAVAGRPIIASNYEALAERVIDGKTGYSISGDIKSDEAHRQFIEKTVKLLKDDQLTDEMGERAALNKMDMLTSSIAHSWESLILK